MEMLGEIGGYENIDPFLKAVKAGETRLMGFGHRVYKNYDPGPGSSSRRPTTCSR